MCLHSTKELNMKFLVENSNTVLYHKILRFNNLEEKDF